MIPVEKEQCAELSAEWQQLIQNYWTGSPPSARRGGRLILRRSVRDQRYSLNPIRKGWAMISEFGIQPLRRMLCGNSINGGISAGRFCSLYTVSFKITSQPQFPDYPSLIYTRVKYSVEQLLQEEIIPHLVKAHGPLLAKVSP